MSKSFNLGGGVRVRVGTKSSSVSVGGKRGRVTVNSKGQRTATLRAGGASVTSRSRSAARPKVAATRQLPDRSARPAQAFPPRRKTADGWVALDREGVLIQRAVEGQFRVDPSKITKLELDGKTLVMDVAGQGEWRFQLKTWISSWDLRYVNAVARAAQLNGR